MKNYLYILTLFLLASCGAEQSNVNQLLGESHFRGNAIGDKREKVEKRTATDNLIDKSESTILCELTDANTETTVRYDFDGENLYSIQADIFFSDSTELSAFQKDLVLHYNTKYGEVNEDMGFLVWQEDGKVEFTLADESIEFGQPKLSLTIYNFSY